MLVVAGDDPSGGAGRAVDEEAATQLGFEVHSVVTADTDQDEDEVRGVGERPVQEWADEALAALDRDPQAIKFGLLPSSAALHAAAELVHESRARRPERAVVVDPVLVSSSGHRFLSPDDAMLFVQEVGPAGAILTPNLSEAAELSGRSLESLELDFDQRIAAAREILQEGTAGIVIKGGHGSGAWIRDLVLTPPGAAYWIEHSNRGGDGLRGSGCRHATALACGLARGRSLPAAARDAGAFVARRIELSAKGGGVPPVDS